MAAETMGINTTKTKVIAFVCSAFVAGIAGGLYAHLQAFLNPENFSSLKSTDLLLYLYAGGVGSYSSAFLGAMIFTLFPEFLRIFNLGEWRLVIYSLCLILIMINRPKGIFGRHEFGFMRYGRPENPYQKLDNAGIISVFVRRIRERAGQKSGGRAL